MQNNLTPIDFFKVLCVMCVWGFNFVALKYAVIDVPPIAMTFVRFLITSVCLCYFFKPVLSIIKKMIPISFVMGIGHFGLLYVGISGVDAATTAILIQLGAPFSVLLAFFVFKETLAKTVALGIAICFSGAFFLSGEPQGGYFWSIIAIILSAFCWALANILIKKSDINNPMVIIFWVNFMALPGLFVLSLLLESGQVEALLNAHISAWLGLLYTVLASSLIGYYLWYKLLADYPVNKVVPYSLAVPFIGAVSSILVFSEPVTVYKIIGGLLTICGVALIYMNQKRTKKLEIKES